MGKEKPDLSGHRYGYFTIVKKHTEKTVDGRDLWECRCDCGNIRYKTESYLKSRPNVACGCRRNNRNRHKDLTGERFGRLSVLGISGRDEHSHIIWECKCDCGNITYLHTSNLTCGITRSCGCLNREVQTEGKYTHRMTDTRLYSIWHNMKTRCSNSNTKSFMYYGERDVDVCNEWLDFEPFMEWAENHGYREDLTLERIDVYKGYFPENCTWIPLGRQASNKRTSRKIRIDDEEKTIKDWSVIMKISKETLRRKVNKGISEEELCHLLEVGLEK